MRTRASFAFAGILIIALLAVVGFAAFSPRLGEAVEPVTTEATPQPAVPTTASGRVLGAVVAAALSAEPTLAVSEARAVEAAPTADSSVEPSSTSAPQPSPTTTTTTTKAPSPKTSTATPLDTAAPEIAVTWPADDETVTDRVIEFTGTTEAGAVVTSGNYSATVDEAGDWKIKLVLLEGRNRAYFTASDKAGNETTAAIVVNYDAPALTTTKAPATTTTTTTDAPTTTTKPPIDGGRRDVEEWRYLVEQYFLPELVEEALVVMRCESHGNPLAENGRSGAAGLMQFIPSTWSWASKKAGWAGASAFDPEANVASAAWLTERSMSGGKDAWSHWSCKP